ncbi:MAG: hypothetical protein WC979_02930 [Candidatus Pacearchaeota archaeon]|jgi:hypothetical protein|nr:hypothetical protein [Clostridia bacterium]
MDYKEYKESNIRIGFIDKFTEIENTRTLSHRYTGKILNVYVEFDVYLAKGGFGPDKKYSVDCLYTDEISIDKQLPLNGFNSNACFHIGEVIDNAIADFAEKNGLTLCNKINSWPFGIAVITKLDAEMQAVHDETQNEKEKRIKELHKHREK